LKNVDPFVSTIVKQTAALRVAVGVLVALVHGYIKYSQLQYALTLNMVPLQLP
jgi:hypothetical protein